MSSKRGKTPTAQDSNNGSRVDLRREIVEYLRAHPDAADTVDGILEWWIPMQCYENAKNDIQQALLDLKQQGFIEEIVLGNGNRLYRLASGK